MSSSTPRGSAKAWFGTGTSHVTGDEAIYIKSFGEYELVPVIQGCHTEIASGSSYKDGTCVALASDVSVHCHLV